MTHVFLHVFLDDRDFPPANGTSEPTVVLSERQNRTH